MRIVVLIKQVPDTWGERRLDPRTLRVDRAASLAVIDEIGERALDVALRIKEAEGAEVIAVTMGPDTARDMLRGALALGLDSVLHIVDEQLAGADARWTAEVLLGAVRHLEPDLLLAGNESTDGRGGVVPAMLAELLGWPLLGSVDSLEHADGSVRADRATEVASTVVTAALPAVVSITERVGEPRFPNFRGIIAAKKKPLGELGWPVLDVDGTDGGRSVVTALAPRETHGAGIRIVDDGTAAEQVADFLTRHHLI